MPYLDDSSFVAGNLLKHYHERHKGVKPEPITDLDALRADGNGMMDNDDSNMDNSFSDDDINVVRIGRET